MSTIHNFHLVQEFLEPLWGNLSQFTGLNVRKRDVYKSEKPKNNNKGLPLSRKIFRYV